MVNEERRKKIKIHPYKLDTYEVIRLYRRIIRQQQGLNLITRYRDRINHRGSYEHRIRHSKEHHLLELDEI
jgi:hypothetical protein